MAIAKTATHGSLSATQSSAQLVPANSARVGLEVCNIGSNEVFLHFGSGPAVASQGVAIVAGGAYSLPAEVEWLGPIYAICSSGETTTLTYVEFNG